ncbi:hypothetical protein [Streptomyces sp. DH37]|uniref:hypothetical protein n=1 Tax=Streptomyces sp. DH37 TaxID=3040122 RepID=UPI0024426056|nr:hypothetical protein [Streptomyces sp. DH37]MDG9702700.1 hypothetical protein [Streptomyces sp. DH37]
MTRPKKVLATFALAAALMGGAAAPAMADNHMPVGPQGVSTLGPCDNHMPAPGCGGPAAEAQSDNHVG